MIKRTGSYDGIHAVPLPEPAHDDAPVKRGRGRPRKDGSDTAPRTRRSATPAVTEDAVGGLLVMVNMPLTMVPFLQADALDPIETEALAKGIVEQCKQSPAFKRYVQSALKVSGATGLIAPLTLILARRGIRHGLLPGGTTADAQAGQMLGVLAGKLSMSDVSFDAPEPELTSSETEPTLFGSPLPSPTPAGSFETPVD